MADETFDAPHNVPEPAAPLKDGPANAAPEAPDDLGFPEDAAAPEAPELDETPDQAGDALNDAAEDAKSTAANATQTLKEGAAKLTREAGDKAREYAEQGKARAGGALDELARMLTDAAGTVDEKVGGQYGGYARTAAEQVSSFSETVKNKDIDELIADARGFVQKSPAIAIGTAAALGFVLVRLIKSGLDASTNTPDDTGA